MICEDVSGLLLDAQRGRLAPDVRAQVAAHVQTCHACPHEEGAEQLLTEALESRLPRHAAPVALKRRLVALARLGSKASDTLSQRHAIRRSVAD